MAPTTSLPPPFQDLARQRLRAFETQAEVLPDMVESLLALPMDTLRVWACSDFVTNTCSRNPMLVADLTRTGDLLRSYPLDHYRLRAQQLISAVSSEEMLFSVLRRFRQREMVRIAWRDLGGSADPDETMRDLSGFADAVIDATLTKLHAWACEKFGIPESKQGEPQRLVVLGMGKLGARESNFSPDAHLIFVFPKSGHTVTEPATGKRGGLSNDEFFTRLGRSLIRLLDQDTEEGIVFRVDMRLRPFGANGPLAMSFDAMEDYYQTHGRDWERYALIRARPIAGDIEAGIDLLGRLRPFVYRRYLDFGAIEALREMKTLITREVQRKGYREHVTLGPGGIREIEFLGQMFQMIHGGREPELRERQTLVVLARLGERGYLPEPAVTELSSAYGFLRVLEHRLQQTDDRHTHEIPEDESERNRLAAGMGFAQWTDLSQALHRHRDNVRRHFNHILGETDDVTHTDSKRDSRDLTVLMSEVITQAQGAEILHQAGFGDGVRAWEILHTLRNDTKLRFLLERGQRRLEKLLPIALQSVADQGASLTTLERLFQVLEAIGRRSVYFALLRENPVVLEHLTRLCAASPWITNQISRHPSLLDRLLDPRLLYSPPGTSELETDLANRLKQVTQEDIEQEMDILRRFKQANVLRVAAADVCDVMPLMVVSDHLTDIAEVCLRWILRLAWRDLAKRYGQPRAQSNGVGDTGFLIVAYGKLGGIELGYGSDLDLVFLYDSDGNNQYTDGKKAVESSVFFGRLGQRIIHLVSTQTPMGTLYEVDTRLRPSGQSGFLVSNIDAFADYQHQEAWIWEHQALVRARVVAGDPMLAERFQAIRAAVLRLERDPEKLRREVHQMRERMREELDHPPAGFFNLKQGKGGITDIEFIVQYAVLRWADRLEKYLTYSDNIRLLEGIANAGLMEKEDAESLARAYRRYRSEVHVLALQEQPPLVKETTFIEERDTVTRIWDQLIPTGME